MHILSYNKFKLNEAVNFVSINTSNDSAEVGAAYNNNSKMGILRIKGKYGIKDYKISLAIPLIYTGPVQPVNITKKLTNGGKSSEYTIHTSVSGQTHTLDKSDVVKLLDLYNTKATKVTMGRMTLTQTWKFKE